MHRLKRWALRIGLGQAYFDFWWRYRCPFPPLTAKQAARGFYFVHIPKTAGTSMLAALNVEPTPYTHCPAHIIRSLYPQESAHLFHFSVVRDPYARFASSFRYITGRTDWPAQRRFSEAVIGDMSFKTFVQKIEADRWFRNLIMGYEFFFPQSYFTHRHGDALVSETLRFETISDDFERLIRPRFPDVQPLPVLRSHGGGSYEEMYDDAARKVVAILYAQDFALFGYQT